VTEDKYQIIVFYFVIKYIDSCTQIVHIHTHSLTRTLDTHAHTHAYAHARTHVQGTQCTEVSDKLIHHIAQVPEPNEQDL